MHPRKGLVWGCALAAMAALAHPAHAGWNNVFQVCCSSCGGQSAPPVVSGYSAAPAVSGYSDPGCCTPPPTTICTTRYVQRTYYQPVTTYRPTTYQQAVTSYRTSYYYEPVCSYRYSCYFDPCTCSYQKVATPITSYKLRSQCCPVTSYLQRTCMTPVTTMRAMCYYEPVTTCCQTSGGPAVSAPPVASDVTPTPAGPSGDGGVDRFTPPAGTKDDRLPAPPNMGGTDGTSSRRRTEKPAPSVKFSGSHFASLEKHNVTGRMVDGDRKAMADARVLFVSVERKSNQHTTTTDRDGNFRANLGVGAWLVYTYDNDGKPVFSRRVEVPAGRTAQVTLVNR